mgnify:CR=1 FL=1
MIKVNVFVGDRNWIKYLKDPKKYLQIKILKLRKNQKFFRNRKMEFSLKLTGTKEIKRLNKKFRNKNSTTDILSFPFYEKKSIKKFLKTKKNFYLGDIVINLNKVKRNNKKNLNNSFDKLWIHGLLHLLGYKHKLNKDYLKMLKLENSFLKSIN